jgi:DnaJ like chaperone protein
MSIWTRIADTISGLLAKGDGLSALFDRGHVQPEKSVAFTIAVVSLGAKMAKADGRVKPTEVAAFRRVFQIAPEDEPAAARVFNLARQDIAGFDAYAARIARLFKRQPRTLEDILEGLFEVATADGGYHEGEESFLRRVADIFGVAPAAFASIEARHVPEGEARDPWRVLGLPRNADLAIARAQWRKLVRKNHPDRIIARGLPSECVTLANARLAAINAAWEEISAMRTPRAPAA